MKQFVVFTWDINGDKLSEYDIMPHLLNQYIKLSRKHKPKSFNDFREFIKKESTYQWWSRCEYEIIITGWPKYKNNVKIDVHQQVMMNIDIITKVLMDNCKEYRINQRNNVVES